MRPYRSMLFVPGHKPNWVDKAIAAGADSIVLDLEDSVPVELKDAARQQVADSITQVRAKGNRVGLFVRTNGLPTRLTGGDLETVVVDGLDGVFAPKVEDAADVLAFGALLDHFEVRNGVSGLELIVPMETARGIANCAEIACASPRMGAMLGSTAEHADIARAVGYVWTPEGLETLYYRSKVLLACRVPGIHPMTGLWEHIADLDGLRAFARQSREIGFRGMIAIHPSHVRTINEVFTPDADEVALYEGMVAAYDDAAARGDGAVLYRGRHIDKAHADKARDWLAMAAELTALDEG